MGGTGSRGGEAGGAVRRHLSNLYEVRCDFGTMDASVWSVERPVGVYAAVS